VRRIIQYKTVKGSKYIINLDKEVNALIAKGFQPFGSPYIFQDIELFACQGGREARFEVGRRNRGARAEGISWFKMKRRVN